MLQKTLSKVNVLTPDRDASELDVGEVLPSPSPLIPRLLLELVVVREASIVK